jgi:Zn-dependent protease/predicted transcriptional regulator
LDRAVVKWSFRLLRVSGIDIRVHATFLIIVWLGALEWGQRYGSAGYVFGALLICAAFVCVTLHELGHSLVAQRFGVEVKEILLLPIGGVAQLRREPRKASQELLIAIAGPLVNVLIAAILFAALRPGALDEVVPFAGSEVFSAPSVRGFAGWLLFFNTGLALFNMIPALPMDGGRVLRALLTMRVGKQRATRFAAGLGQVLAVGFVVFAFWGPGSPVLALVGVFVFFAAAQERSSQVTASVLSELRAGEVCDPEALALSPSDQLGAVIDQLLRSSQNAFAVLHGKDLVGVVTREDVLRAAPRLGPAAPVSQIMRRELKAVRAELPLDQLRSILMEHRAPAVVMANDGPLGVLTLEDLGRIAAVMHELASRGLRRPVPAAASEG